MYEIYRVKQGETLDLIAKTNNIDLQTLYQINNFPPFYSLVAGTDIYLPNKKNLFDYYLVKNDDTIDSIARKYNINKMILLMLNGLDPQDIVHPGDVIIVPNKNTDFYITKKGDNLASILDNTNLDNANDIKNELYVLEDQLLIFNKK